MWNEGSGSPPWGIPPEIAGDVAEFETKLQQMRSGALCDEDFKKFRLARGVYGQRQPGVQMIRVKIPYGRLKAHQLRRLGDVAEATLRKVGHITTRQDMQYHFIPLDEIPRFLAWLGDAQLTTREACFNTVRNVTACPFAGSAANEVFDVSPHSHAVARHFLYKDFCANMPRKFKIALEGCPVDHALTWIHDIGLLARIQDGKRGFRMTIGGGLGTTPELGHLLHDFVPEEEVLPWCEAAVRIFDREGNRKVRHRARFKFVIRKHGMEKVAAMIAEVRATLPREIPIDRDVDPAPQLPRDRKPSGRIAAGFSAWQIENVIPQAQPGYAIAIVKVPLGDLTREQFYGLAEIVERYGEGEARLMLEQNVALKSIPADCLPDVFEALTTFGLAGAGSHDLGDALSCPGADTCNLGITSSRGLAKDINQRLVHLRTAPEAKGVDVKISGCPNSCAQHHTAAIGFYGMARKIGGRPAPAYQVHLGGGDGIGAEGEGQRFGRMIAKVPARNAAPMVERLLALYRKDRVGEESFLKWSRRVDDEIVTAAIKDLTVAAADPSDEGLFVDLGDSGRFTPETGAGECAA